MRSSVSTRCDLRCTKCIEAEVVAVVHRIQLAVARTSLLEAVVVAHIGSETDYELLVSPNSESSYTQNRCHSQVQTIIKESSLVGFILFSLTSRFLIL